MNRPLVDDARLRGTWSLVHTWRRRWAPTAEHCRNHPFRGRHWGRRPRCLSDWRWLGPISCDVRSGRGEPRGLSRSDRATRPSQYDFRRIPLRAQQAQAIEPPIHSGITHHPRSAVPSKHRGGRRLRVCYQIHQIAHGTKDIRRKTAKTSDRVLFYFVEACPRTVAGKYPCNPVCWLPHCSEFNTRSIVVVALLFGAFSQLRQHAEDHCETLENPAPKVPYCDPA
jgi:hypothetical protein